MKKNAFLKQLTEKLLANNFQLYTEEDGKTGFDTARKTQPNIIVTSYNLNGLKGTDLCFMVKNSSKLSATPFILIASYMSSQERINAFRYGVDAIVPTSAPQAELIVRIESLIHNYQSLMQKSLKCRSSLTGQLDDFKLAEILQMLHVNQKTGILNLYFDLGRGQIDFANGEMKFAIFEKITGEAAVKKMMIGAHGSFSFENDVSENEKNIDKPSMQLILDCCQMLDESDLPSMSK